MAYTTTENSSDFSISVVSQNPTDLRAGITAGPNLLLDDRSPSHAQVYGWDKPYRHFSRGDLRSFLSSVQDLGQGSHGFVDEVKISRSNFSSLVRKRVIVKPGLQGQKKKQVIEQEARILATLNHPHIVTFIGSYSEWENSIQVGYSLLMAPVGDSDLKTFFETLGDGKDRRHSEKLLWVPRWFGCLASALKYIHKQNIRHEDIKPSNIIHRGPDIFFTDFSSAGSFAVDDDSSTESPSRCTARYAAPEVGTHLAPDEKPQRHGTKSDVFSLACVYLEMLTVLSDRSVESLHGFCTLQALLSQEPYHNPRPTHFNYHQVADSIGDWFSDKAIHQNHREIYKDILEPMLRPVRESRPDAGTVHFQLKQRLGILQLPCDCQRQSQSNQPRRSSSSIGESTTPANTGRPPLLSPARTVPLLPSSNSNINHPLPAAAQGFIRLSDIPDP